MRKLFIFLPLLLLACNVLSTPTAMPSLPPSTPEKTLLEIAMTSTAQAGQVTATAESLAATAEHTLNNPPPTVVPEASATSEFSGFTQTRLKKSTGEFKPQIAKLAEEARTLHQMPIAHFTSIEDCKPCKTIRKALEEKNPALLAAFEGVYLIDINVDQWGWDHARKGFDFQHIPVFFKLDYEGKPTGEKLDLYAFSENDLQGMIKALDEFFHDEE